MSHEDPAEQETAQRRKAEFASTFDRMVDANLGLTASNVELAKTVRTTLLVVAAFAVLSMSWSAFTTYSMREDLGDMRMMLQAILDAVQKTHT